MEAVAGVTESEVKTAAVTVNVPEPLTAPDCAVIVAVPWAKLVASPPFLTVATAVADEVHWALLLMFCLVPLLYVPVAVNCWLLPAAMEAFVGVTESEVNTAGVTVKATDPLIVPTLAL